ncbi:hypothetical protein V7O66_03150 [Methanolobus sp. ZRKC3]|uniref:hypothetical protein n=1 Tax=Methanolobus sp. ZRKC3 TaxID=3125786 RepID=UPI003243AA41
MSDEITNYRDYEYETLKDGIFWHTYIYKKISRIDYEIVNVFKSLIQPTKENIHKNIDQTIYGE